MTTLNAMADCSEDYLIALRLEAEFALEDANADVASLIPPQFRKGSPLNQVNTQLNEFIIFIYHRLSLFSGRGHCTKAPIV